MARKARSGSSGCNLGQHLHHGSKTIWISGLIIAVVAAAGVGIGLHKRTAHETSALQTVNTPAAKPMRASPEALDVLTQLRNRYGSVSHQQTSSDLDPAESNSGLLHSTSPLLPGLTDDFQANPAGILVRFPATSGKPDAKVVLPSHANAPFELQATRTGMRVQAQLEGVQNTAAEMADGYAVYRQALGPKTTVLRRAMPNGSEDFVSFAEAPKDALVSYGMTLDSSVTGLRLVSNTLELLDSSGTPRLRVAPPYIVSADGNWVEAKLALNGCAADSNPSDPSGRTLTAPGSQSCQLRVTWDNDAVEYPALLDPTWMTTGSMATPRQGHTATLLSTGKVLVAGGTNGSTALATAELYDRTTGTWAATGSMTGARQWHTAVQLNTSSNPTTSGKVLIAGGRNGTTSLNTAQLYSPSAGTWVAAANLNVARQQHTATLLPSGKVLVTGGINSTTLLATAATYDPSSSVGTWTATTGPMPSALKFHSASLLSTTNPQLNGKVLICGGNNGTASKNAVYLYDPAQLAFSTLANMPIAREGQSATILTNTKLLLAGGKNGTTTLNTAVLFDPSIGPGSWSTTGNMTAARQGHTASQLSNGQVLVTGGSNGSTALSSAELYNGTTAWTATTAMPAAVQGHTATALANGVVLVAGGLNGTTTQSASRLYDVTGGNTCTSGAQCQSGNCVSGVCCNTACTDQCSSCSLAGLVGICSPKTNGTACDDGSACTQSDTCQSGACTGANPVTCTALDQCHVAGTCNTSTGACTNPTAPNGISCTDNNACTTGDSCQSGACAAGGPVTCTASDACHVAGTCDTITGTCSNPNAPDGTACSDSNVCTEGDQCAAGACQAGNPVATDDGDACTIDSCDSATGVRHVPNTTDPVCAQWYSGGLQLKVMTTSCGSKRVTQSLQVTNSGADTINLSDIKVKLWVNDTNGSDITAQVLAAGCVTSVSSFPSCSVQVTAATTDITQFDTCGPDSTHRANREITIGTSDPAQLAPGQIWNDLQLSVQLANGGSFTPGTSTWYSPCLMAAHYVADQHYGVYYKERLVYSAGINAPDCRGPHAAQRLSGHVTQEMKMAPYVGRVPPNTPVRIEIGLPHANPTNGPTLESLVQDVTNPNSPNYRHHITAEEFAIRYGATADDYDKIQTWATANKFTVKTQYSNKLLLSVRGTAAAVEQALYLNLNYYQRPDGSQFYAPDREPSLEADATVSHISALDSFEVPAATYMSNGSYANGNLYTAKDLRKAYGCTDLDGDGQVLGLFSINGYVQENLISDVEMYKTTSEIVSSTPITQCNRADSTDGRCAPNPRADDHDPCNGSSGELILDVDMALAIAPGLSNIVIIEDQMEQMAGVLNWVATGSINGKKINQFSISYAIRTDKNVEVALMQLAAQGQSVIRGTVDKGAYPIGSPAAEMLNALITFAGGTQMVLNTNSVSEEAWNEGFRPSLCTDHDIYVAGGCGVLPAFSLPEYQQKMPWNWMDIGGSALYRNVPDVSMVARDVLMCEQAKCFGVGGTSVSSPLWAAFTALANQQSAKVGRNPVGFLNPTLYAIGNSSAYNRTFNDVPSGGSISTGGEPPTYYTRTGFDIPTGWGSPKCELATQLASQSPAPNKTVSTGEFHSCAVRSDNSVSCWGATQYNFGQLGNGSTTGSTIPVPVTNLTAVHADAGSLSAGQTHTCAVLSDGTVQCWGRNNLGMLGNGSNADSSVPVVVSQLTGARSVASGAVHSCASLDNGGVKCWGYNSVGQLGNNSIENSRTPVEVSNLSQVTAISAGSDFTCALTTTGAVKCWGDNQAGKLGNGSTASKSLVPVSVSGISNAIAIGAAYEHACAVLSDHTVRCWGSNYEGCLGNGTATDSNIPVTVLLDASTTLTGVSAVSGGLEHTCSLMSDGRVTCWGRNIAGQLGDGQSGSFYRPYAGYVLYGPDHLTDANAISSNYYHNCVLLKNGSIACWGSNDYGQIGDSTTTDRVTPSPVIFY